MAVKIGDKIDCTGYDGWFGTGVVTKVRDNGALSVKRDDNGDSWYVAEGYYKVISTTNSTMTLIEKAKLAFKGEPEKSFIKAGVMDSNENLTKEGQELVLTYLLNKYGDDFKTTVVDPILKEEETKA